MKTKKSYYGVYDKQVGKNKYVQEIKAKKSYGQNFLTDESVVDQIIEASSLSDDDIVIEIGPGKGVLTKRLVQKAGHVFALELDKRMISFLKSHLGNIDKLSLIQADAVTLDPLDLVKSVELPEKRLLKLVANIPYNITTSILEWILKYKSCFSDVVLMVQKEVCDKLLERPGGHNYSAITAKIQYSSLPYRVCDVASSSFEPEPKVDSAVIRLDMTKSEEYHKAQVFKMIDECFRLRRKTLRNSLSSGTLFGSDQKLLLEVLFRCGIDPFLRAEQVSVAQFIQLTKTYDELKS